MLFFPYENFYIVSRLKPVEVQAKLETVVSQNSGSSFFNFRSWVSSANTTPFKGYAVNGTFEFEPNINYRNSFIPQIAGSTEVYPGGSRIHIKMKLKIFVTVFMCVWLGGVGVASLSFIPQLISDQRTPADLIPFGMFVFGYLLATGGFKYESSKVRSALLSLLEGEIERQ